MYSLSNKQTVFDREVFCADGLLKLTLMIIIKQRRVRHHKLVEKLATDFMLPLVDPNSVQLVTHTLVCI